MYLKCVEGDVCGYHGMPEDKQVGAKQNHA